MISIDHGLHLMAAVPLADGLDEGHCLNSPHDDAPMESRCDTPTRDCGALRMLGCRGDMYDAKTFRTASMRRSIRSRTLPPSATCASPTCTLYERNRLLDRPT
jgi:hypothetical protein